MAKHKEDKDEVTTREAIALHDEAGNPKSEAQLRMEAAAKQPKKRYLLLAGAHLENVYNPETGLNEQHAYDSDPSVNEGNIVESHRDLITMFGANKFKLIDDDKVVLERSGEAREGKRFTREEKVQAGRDSINKVTEEEARADNPNDPNKKINYSENAGFEQPPPAAERENPIDRRIAEKKPAPAKKK